MTVEQGLRSSGESTVSSVGEFLREIREEIARCRKCSGRRKLKTAVPLDWFGARGTGYMLVYERKQGTDRLAGMTECLKLLDDDRFEKLDELFFLEHAICTTCRPLVQLEIRTLRPKLVVTLGHRATEAVLRRKIKMTKEHASRHRVDDTEVLPLLVPSTGSIRTLKACGLTLKSYRLWLVGFLGSLVDTL